MSGGFKADEVIRRWSVALGVAVVALTLSSCSGLPGGGGDDKKIELPTQMGELLKQDAACAKALGDPETVARCVENAAQQAEVTDDTAARLSRTFDGPAAAGATYSSADLHFTAEVYAVRADAPGLWTRVGGDAWEQRAGVHSMQWVESTAGVDCLVSAIMTVPLDAEIGPNDMTIEQCQKSDGGLTVEFFPLASTAEASLTVEQVAAWLNEVHSALT